MPVGHEVGHDAHADVDIATLDVRTEGDHLAGTVGDGDERKPGARKASRGDGEVDVVQRRGAQPDQHVARAGLRVGQGGLAKSGQRRGDELDGLHGSLL